jgi:hypothetical protein
MANSNADAWIQAARDRFGLTLLSAIIGHEPDGAAM